MPPFKIDGRIQWSGNPVLRFGTFNLTNRPKFQLWKELKKPRKAQFQFHGINNSIEMEYLANYLQLVLTTKGQIQADG